MLAAYPTAAWADDVAKLRLSGAYWRRKRLEARLIAVEVARVLSGARTAQATPERISSDDMLAMMGL